MVRECSGLRKREIAPGHAARGLRLLGRSHGFRRSRSARLALPKPSVAKPTATLCQSGRKGFYRQGGEKARFDQQPIEAAGAVSACLQAYRITGDSRWRSEAWSAFNWFLGDNDLQLPLYDSVTGGCRDGLHPDRANENQGAESTLSFLMALLEMRSLQEPDNPGTRGELFVATTN